MPFVQQRASAPPAQTVMSPLPAHQLAALLDAFRIPAVIETAGGRVAPPPGGLQNALGAEAPAVLEPAAAKNKKQNKKKKNKKKKKAAGSSSPAETSAAASSSASTSASAAASSSASTSASASISASASASTSASASSSSPSPSASSSATSSPDPGLPLCTARRCLLDCGKAHALPAHFAGLTHKPSLARVAASAANTLSQPLALPDATAMSVDEIKTDIQQVFGTLDAQQRAVVAYLWELTRVEVERMRIRGQLPPDMFARMGGPSHFMNGLQIEHSAELVERLAAGQCPKACKGKHREV